MLSSHGLWPCSSWRRRRFVRRDASALSTEAVVASGWGPTASRRRVAGGPGDDPLGWKELTAIWPSSAEATGGEGVSQPGQSQGGEEEAEVAEGDVIEVSHHEEVDDDP